MQIILEANGLWEMIEPNEKTQADNKKDKTAMAFLYQALPEEQLLQITKYKTAKTIWDALKTRHIGEERIQQARLQTLKSDFEMLHMKEDETIDTFTTKLTTLVNKAASLGHTMEDETLVRKLLNAVPDRYLQIVASIEQYSDLSEMTLEEAIGRLKTCTKKDPITPPTPSGKKYIFLLVDDYSRYMWVYFLTTKDQAFDTFKEFKKSIENELRTTLKMLRTDRGGEFTSNEFMQYCKENGIARQLTAPYSPQQNGVVERRNRTIMSMTRSRLVAKGYIQEAWHKTLKKSPPVAQNETMQLVLAIAANNKWEVHHLDVKSAFLHGDLKEEVYVTQPEGFIKRQDNGKVYRLIKALYGLRQAPRAWNIKLDNTLKSLDFKKCALEQAIYTKKSKDSILLIGVYVDDLIITGTPKKEIDKFKAQMEEKFEMSDLGLLAYYLGIEVTQTNGDISIKQSAYASKILKEAGMIDCNETLIPMDPGTRLTKITEGTMVNSTEYRSLIGCLRYLLHTRPDLSYSVGLLSRFMQEPREQHMKAIRQVLRYVKGTKDHGITYKHNGGNKIHGYSDSSYGVNTTEGKGTTGIIFYYGESPISWSTQKQATVALSSCESEFIAATAAATQALWLKRLLSKLTHTQEKKVIIQVDNKSAIALMKNLVFHGRSKHIDTKYHFIRECVERNDI
ncbi:ribonuclease H-like domain, reverse transcriptase, RNA-dependent DNA polymerase [Tanacetum coccineum]|uniref:Ribonuclease H-like domain, reverse transcriptase, RNA-dependent DNA polymerase n=1 Tax=Tanacetum coccineum TaxID=301880 RepID=A0ABQ5DPH9_9ASTR